MFVRWQHRTTAREGWLGHDGVQWKAILAESMRVDGKPRQRHIALLGSFLDCRNLIYRRNQRIWFWNDVNARLDQLGDRVSPEARIKIESAIIWKVNRPTPGEIEDLAKDRAAEALNSRRP